jgi:hypothetical protein
MTQHEWQTCTDPTPMLEFLWRSGSHRKLRLFACACCHRVRHLLTGDDSRIAVEVAERHADGLATDDRLAEATDPLEVAAPQGRPYPNATAYYASWQHAPDAATSTAKAALEAIEDAAGDADAERAAQVASLRDIFGSPFRSVTLDPAWLTPGVVALAQAIYDRRAFDRIPELADALEQAGCTDADILAHCRGEGPHVRGCWALDLILGKE